MSPYNRALLFTGWIFLVFLSFPVWASLVYEYFGDTGMSVAGGLLLLHGAATLYLFVCPKCGESVFRTY